MGRGSRAERLSRVSVGGETGSTWASNYVGRRPSLPPLLSAPRFSPFASLELLPLAGFYFLFLTSGWSLFFISFGQCGCSVRHGLCAGDSSAWLGACFHQADRRRDVRSRRELSSSRCARSCSYSLLNSSRFAPGRIGCPLPHAYSACGLCRRSANVRPSRFGLRR